MENTKICSKCGRELPLECFGKHKSKKDGLQPYCKECQKQYGKQYWKEYYARHRDEQLEKNKQYYAEHRDELIEYKKQWRADNPEYDKLHGKQYYAEHRKERNQYFAERYATIEGYARNIRNSNLREDRKYGRCGKDEDPLPTIEQYIELLQQRDYYDKKHYPFNEMGVDRIDNSKAHTIDNIVPCSTAHNVQRGRKTFEEFKELMQNGF
jgi:hypothetical protein